MRDIIQILETTSIPVLILVALVFLARRFFESWLKQYFATLDGQMKQRFAALEGVMKSSLSVTEGLRGNEQTELVEFRVAVERWEYFLQTGIADLLMKSEQPTFEPADFNRQDVDLFGAVRVAAVKASIYLRNPELEIELLKTVSSIRNLYYPLLAATMQRVLDLQGQMLPYLTRMRLFEASGMKDTSVALSAQEAQVLVGMRHKMSDELRTYAEQLVGQYKPIAEQLYDLKSRINVHIYRPIRSAAIDKA